MFLINIHACCWRINEQPFGLLDKIISHLQLPSLNAITILTEMSSWRLSLTAVSWNIHLQENSAVFIHSRSFYFTLSDMRESTMWSLQEQSWGVGVGYLIPIIISYLIHKIRTIIIIHNACMTLLLMLL